MQLAALSDRKLVARFADNVRGYPTDDGLQKQGWVQFVIVYPSKSDAFSVESCCEKMYLYSP